MIEIPRNTIDLKQDLSFSSAASKYIFTKVMLYRREVLTLIKDGTYMGAWQMASLATILGRVVNSVYPIYAAETVRKDLHRIFRPLGPQAIDACESIYSLDEYSRSGIEAT